MRTYTQDKPTGNDRSADFVQRAIRRIYEELQIYDSEDISVEHTTRGLRLYLKKHIAGGTSTTTNAGWNYRGLYDAGTTYVTFDVVQFGSGTAAGMYLSTLDNNTNAPDSGIGWLQVSTATGTWL